MRLWERPRVEGEARALEAYRARLGKQLPFFALEIARADQRGAGQVHIISGQSHHGAHGAFIGYRGVGRDVTEQRRAERSLSQAKERLEMALDGGNLAEWHYDAVNDELYAGDGWVRFLGHADSPTVNRCAVFFATIHPDERESSRAAWAGSLKGAVAEYETEFRAALRGGGWQWLHARGRVTARDAAGRGLRMSGIAAAIAAQKRAALALSEPAQRV